jgi:hypothetical protein
MKDCSIIFNFLSFLFLIIHSFFVRIIDNKLLNIGINAAFISAPYVYLYHFVKKKQNNILPVYPLIGYFFSSVFLIIFVLNSKC